MHMDASGEKNDKSHTVHDFNVMKGESETPSESINAIFLSMTKLYSTLLNIKMILLMVEVQADVYVPK